MKELSIEEKAKAYDKAIKVIKDNLDALNEITETGTEVVNIQPIKNCFYRAFSELKESEDERILKQLRDFFKNHINSVYEEIGDNNAVLAWLEKQGEQKPQGKSALEAIKEEKVDNANKIEPKFKVGDWISGYYTNYKVLSVNNDGYLVEDVDGNKINILFENEKFHHLWTIQDAKDGDVLATKDNHICIFDNTVEEGKYPFAYCGLSIFGFEVYDRAMPFTHFDVYPATKEQRDLLFTNMEEAGYEWDANHKQLKKIEQKKVIHKELTEFEKAVKQVMEEAIECGDTHNLKADAEMLLSLVQKSAWSEEDEEMLNSFLHKLEVCDLLSNKECIWIRNKFKALKHRVQPQSTWKPSDKQMKQLGLIAKQNKDNMIGKELMTLYQDLKKLRKE